MSINEMTEAELIEAILKAQADDIDNLPRCGPGEICPAMLKWKLHMTDRQARYAISKAFYEGLLEPAWITFVDPWGTSKRSKGYRWIGGNPGG